MAHVPMMRLGRVAQIVRPDATTTVYGYDPADNLTSMADVRGTTSYHYDERNLLVRMDIPDGTGHAVSIFDHDDGRQTDAWHDVDVPADVWVFTTVVGAALGDAW